MFSLKNGRPCEIWKSMPIMLCHPSTRDTSTGHGKNKYYCHWIHLMACTSVYRKFQQRTLKNLEPPIFFFFSFYYFNFHLILIPNLQFIRKLNPRQTPFYFIGDFIPTSCNFLHTHIAMITIFFFFFFFFPPFEPIYVRPTLQSRKRGTAKQYVSRASSKDINHHIKHSRS